MSEVVVDTNVWVMPGREHTDRQSLECAEVCRQWLGELRNSNRQLVVDDRWVIMREYRKRISKQSFAGRLLSELQQTGRIIWVTIQFDENDASTAILPPAFGLHNLDPNNRKFVAVALACTPHPPIVNAVDTDYQECAAELKKAGISVQELCPDWLTQKGISS